MGPVSPSGAQKTRPAIPCGTLHVYLNLRSAIARSAHFFHGLPLDRKRWEQGRRRCQAAAEPPRGRRKQASALQSDTGLAQEDAEWRLSWRGEL